MFSTEKSQIEICLLKSSLDEIENELVVQVGHHVFVPFLLFNIVYV